jgi:hypothetical protein
VYREASILAAELPEESDQFRFLRAARLAPQPSMTRGCVSLEGSSATLSCRYLARSPQEAGLRTSMMSTSTSLTWLMSTSTSLMYFHIRGHSKTGLVFPRCGQVSVTSCRHWQKVRNLVRASSNVARNLVIKSSCPRSDLWPTWGDLSAWGTYGLT